LSEYNVVYVHKEKGRRPFGAELPSDVQRLLTPGARELRFDRRVRHDDDIRVCLDTVELPSGEQLSLIELKAYNERGNFFAAGKYLLRHNHTILTNYPKVRLVEEFAQR
jgi:hypothetical protein